MAQRVRDEEGRAILAQWRRFLEGKQRDLTRRPGKPYGFQLAKKFINEHENLEEVLNQIQYWDFFACFDLKDCDIKKIIKFPLPELKILALKKNGNGTLQILSNGHWSKLKVLKLQNGNFDNKGISWLVKAQMPELKILSLSYNRFDQNGFRILCRSPWKIRKLEASFNQVKGKEPWKWLSQANFDLNYLDLENEKNECSLVPFLQALKMNSPLLVILNFQSQIFLKSSEKNALQSKWRKIAYFFS